MSLMDRIGSRNRHATERHVEEPVDLDPEQFLRRWTAGYPVLDVRTPPEFAERHLDGARNVDILQEGFVEAVGRLSLDRKRPVYLYCRSGNRSGHAARILRRHGYLRAFNVGGLDDLVG